jgi:hypothetical protein
MVDGSLVGGYLISVSVTGVHLMGVHPIGVYLMGVYLVSVHLMGLYIMGAYLIRLQGTRLCAWYTPVNEDARLRSICRRGCTSGRYTSGRCTSTRSSLPVNMYEIYGNFDFRK